MQAISKREQRLAGLARGVRAAIVVPVLFALALLVAREPDMAGFAVFGTFAHLVMVNYSATGGARSTECVALTLLGGVIVFVGTLVSEHLWLAVAGAVTAGFLAEWPALTKGHLVVIRPALLMAFMLAVAIPTPLQSLPPELYGWLLAGMIAQPALQLLWIPIRKVRSVQIDAVPSASVRNAVCAGAAMGLAILVARLLGLHHASSAPRQRKPHAMTGLGRVGCPKATLAYGTAAGHCQTLQAGTTTIAFQSACANSNSQCVNELCLH